MSEIEDFLRKAAQRRKEKKKKPPQPPPPAPLSQPLQQQQPLSQPLHTQQPPDLSPELQSRHVVERSVKQHIDTSDFQARAHEAGFDDLELVDERMQDHLHERFDHALGNLQETTTTTGPTKRRPTSGPVIASLFANPQNIRQAFIMSEIMKPLALRDDEPEPS